MVRRRRSRERRPAAGAPAVAPAPAPAPRPVDVPRTPTTVPTEADARALARRLMSPDRRWPVAVVTIASGEPEPYADVDELVAALQGLAEVVVMPTSDASWGMSEVMPPQTQVYGGACRVYPVGDAWVAAPRRAPLRFAYSRRERRAVTDVLIADGMAAAAAAGLHHTAGAVDARPVAGQVVGVVGQRALVRLDDGSMATLWEELTGFDVPLGRLVQAGQRVTGAVDPETRRLELVAPPPEPAQPYDAGAVVLAQVVRAQAHQVVVRVTAARRVVVAREHVSANPLDRLDALFAPGDVVVARVLTAAPLALSVLDVGDDDVPAVAPAILPGGPPWLTPPPVAEVVVAPDDLDEPRPAPTSPVACPPVPSARVHAASAPATTSRPDEPPPAPRRPTPRDLLERRPPARHRPPRPAVSAPAPATDRPGPAPTAPAGAAVGAGALEPPTHADPAGGAARELVRLRAYTESLERELETSELNRLAFRDKYRAADRARQQLEQRIRSLDASRPTDDVRAWFTDPADALRWAVEHSWASRVPAGEKARLPLRPWTVGPRFVDSLDALGTVSWRRLADVVCDVVVRDPARLSALEHHELRQSGSGNASAVVREDGAVCFRVALQRNTPSARRLHFWRLGDAVELSRVVLHDDMSP